MRYVALLFSLFQALTLVSVAPAIGSEAAPSNGKISIKFAFTPREVRDYKIDATITGRVSASDSEPTKLVDLKAGFNLVVRHRYGRREGDGLLPVEISLLKGSASADGSTLELASSLYPKLTALIDREWYVTDIFGMPQERMAETLPGLNYANHIILFHLPGAHEPRNPGDKWSYILKIPALNESYEFTNQFIREEVIEGIPAAVVRQHIVRKSYSSQDSRTRADFKATVESAFAVNGGKLLKAHAECEINLSSPTSSGERNEIPKDPTLSKATVRIDISPVKGTDPQQAGQ